MGCGGALLEWRGVVGKIEDADQSRVYPCFIHSLGGVFPRHVCSAAHLRPLPGRPHHHCRPRHHPGRLHHLPRRPRGTLLCTAHGTSCDAHAQHTRSNSPLPCLLHSPPSLCSPCLTQGTPCASYFCCASLACINNTAGAAVCAGVPGKPTSLFLSMDGKVLDVIVRPPTQTGGDDIGKCQAGARKALRGGQLTAQLCCTCQAGSLPTVRSRARSSSGSHSRQAVGE